jgi:hypothetical protein
MAPLLLHDWFCLKPGRDNFKPHNVRDKNLTFCHKHLVNDEILGSLERRFAANEPVKLLIHGDWGVGKTHTINHICWWLDAHRADYPAHPVIIEIGDITKTTRFDALVRPFIEALGLDCLVALVHGYIKVHQNVQQALERKGVSGQVADAFSKLLLASPGSTPPPIVLSAIDYLKGRRPIAGTAMGFGQQLVGSNELFDVLLAIGEMYREVNGERLIFFADEAAKLEAVDADDAVRAHWENANKLIFDDHNNTFGFVYTVSALRRTLPQSLFSPQLQNRLGDGVFEMQNLPPRDVEGFLRNLVDEFVDKSCVDALVAAGAIAGGSYTWEDYPFTPVARQEFVAYFSRTQENSKPRDISHKLTDAAFVAMKSGNRLIDPAALRAAKI